MVSPLSPLQPVLATLTMKTEAGAPGGLGKYPAAWDIAEHHVNSDTLESDRIYILLTFKHFADLHVQTLPTGLIRR